MNISKFLKNKMIYAEAGIAVLLFLLVVALAPQMNEKAASESAEETRALAVEENRKMETASASGEEQTGEHAKSGEEDAQEVIAPGQYPIMGSSQVTVEQMVAYFESAGVPYPSEVLGAGGAPDIQTFCEIYYEEAGAEGVRPEVPFVQSMKETGWLQYGGDSKVEQYNFAGLGTTGGGVEGEYFPDVRTGVRAQIQHLKAYATEDALVRECVDTRYAYVTKGCAPYVEWLGQQENPSGQGWATAESYGYSIVDMINVLKTY